MRIDIFLNLPELFFDYIMNFKKFYTKQYIAAIVVLDFLLVYLFVALKAKDPLAPFQEWYIWLVPAAVIVAAFILAFFTIILVQRPPLESRIVLTSQLLGLFLVAGLIVWVHFGDPFPDVQETNAEHNHKLLKYTTDGKDTSIHKAFAAMEAVMGSPDTFRLNGYAIITGDTMVDGSYRGIVDRVYFSYFFNPFPDSLLIAKWTVWPDKLQMEYADMPFSDDSTYRKIERDAYQQLRETREEFRNLPDSTKTKVREELKAYEEIQELIDR